MGWEEGLGALGSGLSKGVDAYQKQIENLDDREYKRKMLAMQLATHGLQDDGKGGYSKIAGNKGDLDEQYKKLMIRKAEKELAEGKKPSAGEFAAAGYSQRLEQAQDVFDDLGAKGYQPESLKAQAMRMIPESLGLLKDEPTKLQEQAEANFLNAQLRRESGAAISDSERAAGKQQYFAQAGDTPEVKEQKRKNREILLANLKAESGGAYDRSKKQGQIRDKELASRGGLLEREKTLGLMGEGGANASAPPKKGDVRKGYRFKGGDPADKSSWEKAR